MADEAEPSTADDTTQPDPGVQAMEERWLAFWDKEGIYRFDPKSRRPIFSIDTPPPTVSGKMHIGHAYSYNQMDFVARYKRMRGFNLFYPFGFDDNGLPTERLTERETGKRIHDVGRKEFIRLCLETTQKFEEAMEKSWRRIGTSCDWSLVYRTIDKPSVQTSQASFVELHKMGRAYRAKRPSIWCPECATAIAQVEAEDKMLESAFHDIAFDLVPDFMRRDEPERGPRAGETYRQGLGGQIVISTTRPELVPACVAIFTHPDDERTRHLLGRQVRVPVTGQEVPVLASDKVDKEKGTGVVMCCTFGDLTDIDWWQGHKLPLRVAIDSHGKMTDLAGGYAGLSTNDARARMVEDLRGEGRLKSSRPIQHAVNVHERCGTPVEFLVTPQWFVKYLDLKEEFLRRGEAVRWHPEHMKVRYDNWVKGLQWDWCISRQRYFGVPFPVWYCQGCGAEKVAAVADLPVDPVETRPTGPCARCGGSDFEPEHDVMDTWATSSLTPQIAGHWVKDGDRFDQVFPMSLRPQAHEIISFWAFNTIVKAHLHHDATPWSDIQISGFVKLGKGKKMSKSKGDIVEPLDVIAEHSADALRYWSATGASLGEDIIWNPKDLTRAQRLITKLRNVQKFAAAEGAELRDEPAVLTDVDVWILTEFTRTVERVTAHWDAYDYTRAIKETETFLWHVLADHYVELVKSRVRSGDPAAILTLRTVALGILKMLAPVLCFATEDIFQELYRKDGKVKSIHVAPWPEPVLIEEEAAARGELTKDVVAAGRNWKAGKGISLGATLPEIEVVAPPEARPGLLANEEAILATLRADGLRFVDPKDLGSRPVAVKLDMARLGPKHKALMPKVAAAVNALDPAKIPEGGFEVPVEGQTVRLEADEYRLETRPTVSGHDVDAVPVGPVTLLLREK